MRDFENGENGGSFNVPGNSKLAVFRVTPGESFHVRTPQQERAELLMGIERRPRWYARLWRWLRGR